ncbi:hypothetical protein ymoll0001_36860 [Yersinia mollaretii ATCC 43969]|uniref:Uncharacterized protein n=1 Tax=Yersinia mollaretii (strain ATCC 43969 / DSM 18520 / CIP 103324 / CNY 7263 / WAIP 204) TaxID=349967 RepID=A0ABM9Y7X9_YERMW|nr:hypothetical protein ymoll0001_36860 [Yersinia mollaretii ATCC 43969]
MSQLIYSIKLLFNDMKNKVLLEKSVTFETKSLLHMNKT